MDEINKAAFLNGYLMGRKVRTMGMMSSFTHYNYSGYRYRRIAVIKKNSEFKYAVLVRRYNRTYKMLTTNLYISKRPFFYIRRTGYQPSLVNCPSYISNTYRVFQYYHSEDPNGYWSELSTQTSTTNGTAGSFTPQDPMLYDLQAIWTNHDIYHAEQDATGYFVATDSLYLAASEPVPDYE